MTPMSCAWQEEEKSPAPKKDKAKASSKKAEVANGKKASKESSSEEESDDDSDDDSEVSGSFLSRIQVRQVTTGIPVVNFVFRSVSPLGYFLAVVLKFTAIGVMT